MIRRHSSWGTFSRRRSIIVLDDIESAVNRTCCGPGDAFLKDIWKMVPQHHPNVFDSHLCPHTKFQLLTRGHSKDIIKTFPCGKVSTSVDIGGQARVNSRASPTTVCSLAIECGGWCSTAYPCLATYRRMKTLHCTAWKAFNYIFWTAAS